MKPEPTASSPVVRFYWELVRYRQDGGALLPVEALGLPGPVAALSELSEAVKGAGAVLRIAPLVELPPCGPSGAAARGRIATAFTTTAAALNGLVTLDVWPQLPDSSTRFLNTQTAHEVHDRLGALLDAVDVAGRPPGLGVCLDVEPPEPFLQALWTLGRPFERPGELPLAVGAVLGALAGSIRSAREGTERLRGLDEDLRDRGLPRHCAVIPPLGHVGRRERTRTWLLGCPGLDRAGGPLLGRPAPMCYVTLLRRQSGRVDRAREQAVLTRWAGRHARWFSAHPEGATLAIALGQIGRGIVGAEPVYEDPDHLAEDVQLVRRLGFEDVAFFCLEGLLYGPDGVPSDDPMSATRPHRDAWTAAILTGLDPTG